MGLTQDLNKIFDHCYESIDDLVQKRQQPINYDWLISFNTGTFYPDYFTVDTVGRTFVERSLNRLCANRFGRFSISYKVVARFVHLFYDLPFFNDNSHCEWLLSRLKSMPNTMTKWSLVEFFLFMERWMTHVFSEELMTFKDVKADLNASALAITSTIDIDDISHAAFLGSISAACFSNWFDIVVPDLNDRKKQIFNKLHSFVSLQEALPVDSLILTYLTEESRYILYEVDNTGEIIFDLVLITKLLRMGHCVTIVGKYSPILNDATVSDILDLIQNNTCFTFLNYQLRLGNLMVIAANDFPMVGKYLPLVTNEYQNHFQACDVVWLKGQANFQTMPVINHGLFRHSVRYHKPIVLNFIAKTPIVNYCLSQSLVGKVTLGDPLICLI